MTGTRTESQPLRARRRIAGAALTLLFSTALVFAAAPPASAQEEAIRSYDVHIQVQTDGWILVTERIEYDFGSTEHHGIFRDIPSRLTFDNRYDRVYPIDVVSVTASPGTPDQYETSQSGPIFEIKIGDPDRTITGDHVYTITYRVTTTSCTGTSPETSGRCRSSRCARP
jgi:hypothetical protein